MPWYVGLDEAGYGPNLGPLVVASTACLVAGKPNQCLWKKLSKALRKSEHEDDGRLLVDDSKKVNEGPNGLARLERGVLTAMSLGKCRPNCVNDYLASVSLGRSRVSQLSGDVADKSARDVNPSMCREVNGDTYENR